MDRLIHLVQFFVDCIPIRNICHGLSLQYFQCIRPFTDDTNDVNCRNVAINSGEFLLC
jgi:hypothetical protein